MKERQAEIYGNAIILEGGQALTQEPDNPTYTERVGGRRIKTALGDLSNLPPQTPETTDVDINKPEWNNLTKEDIQGF